MNEHEDAKLVDILRQGTAEIGIILSSGQEQCICRYAGELLAWNQRVNLTAITDRQEVMIKHFVDSLMCTLHVPFSGELRVCDIGSGAGFPGLPLKIFKPGLNLVMVETVGKKVDFLNHLVEVLNLTGVKVLHARAEQLGQDPAMREKFDRVVSRAVAAFPVLAEYCLPLLRPGGLMVAFKGPGAFEEVKEAAWGIKVLGGEPAGLYRDRLPVLGDPRSIVVVKKVVLTPGKYPRRAGIPEKRPLKPV